MSDMYCNHRNNDVIHIKLFCYKGNYENDKKTPWN